MTSWPIRFRCRRLILDRRDHIQVTRFRGHGRRGTALALLIPL